MSEGEIPDGARERLAELVRNFQRNEKDYRRANYNETQARTEFISPLLEQVFGWDVRNLKGQPLALREVIEEATVEVGEERLSKKPDYELRLARQRKLFVEAKKPHLRIDRDRAAAFQTRRYGYSANLPVAILTNFHYVAVYDCRYIPLESDEAHVARIALIRYEEFEARFDELWGYLARAGVYSGDFDRRFETGGPPHAGMPFDTYFLRQVRDWRERLAVDIHANRPELDSAELTFAVQLFLSRIVFLRICEDRDIEKYETLKNLAAQGTFDALMAVIAHADEFYDSGLFRLLDDQRLGIRISDTTLHAITSDLYYPRSPYTFAVVETEVLGDIYEQFLGEGIVVEGGEVHIVTKPEVRASGGIVPTPRYIVDAIVARALGPAVAGKSPDDLTGFTAADICCGSGIFLLSVYKYLLDHHLTWYLTNDLSDHSGRRIYEIAEGQWRLTFEEKRRILVQHVRGVDIDASAVEVARFSLLLKLIEDEPADGLQEYVRSKRTPALPSLDGTIRVGNSLVSYSEWTPILGTMPEELIEQVNPFNWAAEFEPDFLRGGFDVIVGNPPYIRIQNMANYSPEEIKFYQASSSPYSTAQQDNFDKYALFIERSLSLLKPTGRVGVIVPHKFMTIHAGRALRRLISSDRLLEEVIHFGVKQVFPGTSNYTCILILDLHGQDRVLVERAGPLEGWRYGERGETSHIPANELTEEAWQFADVETRELLERIRSSVPDRLGGVAEIFVGLQTSADAVYIFEPQGATPTTVTLRWADRDWPIEREIVRPCLHDVSLYPFTRPRPNKWMIFPYKIIEQQHRSAARLIQPDEMAARFPGCWEYLNARREALEKRNVSGGALSERQWYQFGRSQSLTKFDTPKIILPILSQEPRYAFDDLNIVVTGGGNGPYYMIRVLPDSGISDLFLLAVLNHPLSEAFVRTHTSAFRGGYYSHGKQFIESIPVPTPTIRELEKIESSVSDLIDVLGSVETATTPHQRSMLERRASNLKAETEDLVNSLFALSPAEIATARAVPIPT